MTCLLVFHYVRESYSLLSDLFTVKCLHMHHATRCQNMSGPNLLAVANSGWGSPKCITHDMEVYKNIATIAKVLPQFTGIE